MEAKNLDIPELKGKRNLKIDEACQILGLGRTFVYGLISSGQLESLKIGKARRVPVWAIEKYLAAQDGSGTAA